ncbi:MULTISPECIES: AraC family transcriptional regulator [Ensifer]|jgi:AraC-like DNA-binding protein/quercetin dioxygenase-like cupin family protein|uniref:Helix-turn-helix domain-containing protein n=1 Tax=Ensifer canadensis TaxID=555315 RepID=A0AAW4FD38_9HYPH|nr:MULTISPECIES: AraC family transcriptional regulator [Ensifer]MDP9628707.1 AraC-like DNA-binding protein/quercetin dioxygenase-like cupin family protein [Ensifer adhaerens]KQU98353.1 AraC family transcriptional regulator [Ensifer sp. Root31]KQW63112.1 AraC family transcriptional regulator [Ensifer sp. Root1252]KQW85128.1 AraC family transcriptional regulator [Ensifer sp. Root127]KQY71111.1 AraC family transcriptional regulator [Ensifer sp. Root142]
MAKGRFTIFPGRIGGIEAVEAASGHVFARHTHEQFGIGLIHQGAQKSLSGRGMVEAGAGDMITVNPGEVHDGMPIGDAGRSWRMLYFEPSAIADAMEDISQGRTRSAEFTAPAFHDERTSKHFQALFSAITAPDGDRTGMQGEEHVLTLLADVMRVREGKTHGGHVPSAMRRAQSLIDDDPTVAITLSDLAQATGLSRFQVVRGFSKTFGLTPHAYLVQRRIDLARRLIARGVPLAEAAVEGGFADQSHMTRIFVRKYGISPGAYADAFH